MTVVDHLRRAATCIEEFLCCRVSWLWFCLRLILIVAVIFVTERNRRFREVSKKYITDASARDILPRLKS